MNSQVILDSETINYCFESLDDIFKDKNSDKALNIILESKKFV